MESLIKELLNKNIDIVLAINGGGAGAVSDLFKQDNTGNVLETTIINNKSAAIKYVGQGKGYFCSRDYALDLAVESHRRAKTYSVKHRPAVGVGVSAKLYVQNEPGWRTHEIWIAIQLDEETRIFDLQLNPVNIRNRQEQETLVSTLIIDQLLDAVDIEHECLYKNLIYTNEYPAHYIQHATQELLALFNYDKFYFEHTNNVANPIIFPNFGVYADKRVARAIFDAHGKSRYIIPEFSICGLDFWRMQEKIEALKGLKKEEWYGGYLVTNQSLFIDKAKTTGHSTFIISEKEENRVRHTEVVNDSINFIIKDNYAR